MSHPKNPYRESPVVPASFWKEKLLSALLGYAHHRGCGKKIYRPFSRFSPGRCARCGSRMEEECLRKNE